jgi:hypothetical protein
MSSELNSNQARSPSQTIPLNIIKLGKLPNSSYYDILSQENDHSNNNPPRQQQQQGHQQQQPQQQQQNQEHLQQINEVQEEQEEQNEQQQNQPNNNLGIFSVVFSPDNKYLAWTCGYGIVKIMRWTDVNIITRRKSSFGVNVAAATPKTNMTGTPCTPNVSVSHANQARSSLSLSNSSNVNNTPTSSATNQSAHSTPLNCYSLKDNDCESNSQTPNYSFVSNSQEADGLNDIAEIDCGEIVWSLEFGSCESYVKHRRNLHKQSRVYNRFDLKHRLVLAIGLASGKIKIYDAITRKLLFILYDHKDIVRGLKFTKDGSLQLASASYDETIKLWDMLDDGNMYKTLKKHVGYVYACDWSPTASLLCSVGSNRQAYIWNTENYEIKHTLKGHFHDIVTCEFSPDGAILATGSYDTTIILWNPFTGELIRQFCHVLPRPRFIYAGGDNGGHIRSLAFSKNADYLLSICDDK